MCTTHCDLLSPRGKLYTIEDQRRCTQQPQVRTVTIKLLPTGAIGTNFMVDPSNLTSKPPASIITPILRLLLVCDRKVLTEMIPETRLVLCPCFEV